VQIEDFDMQYLLRQSVVIEQVLYQALQFDAVLPHDTDDFQLLLGQVPGDLVRQQVGALTQAGQGGFEFV